MRAHIAVLCLTAVLPTIQGCLFHKKKPPAPAPVAVSAPAPVEQWEAVSPDARLYYDDVNAFTDSTRLTVQDPDTWQDIWRRATRRQASTPPLPDVDFQRQMVLVVPPAR